MDGKVTFDYFYGSGADAFSFYRIPKLLFTYDYFKVLSTDAKVLYGLMLDRMGLSVKNRWFDSDNRAYIYFSIEDIESLYDGIRGMRHDMKNYIADMDALMKQDEDDPLIKVELRKYLESLQLSVDNLDMKYHTGNPVTDVVMQRYVQLAEKNCIEFNADFLFPSDMGVNAFDLSIIMNNALENAIEACINQKEGRKSITLSSYRRENMFFIIIRNSFDGVLSKKEGKIKSTKLDAGNHGYGLQNIEACVEKYYGRAETTVADGYFELAVMLQKQE